MFQQLASETGAQGWVIAAMLFFIAVFVWVAVSAFRTPAAEHEARARLPLDDSPGGDRATDRQRDPESQR
jgi:cbb3-type cytochrome oxidase subunit 3